MILLLTYFFVFISATFICRHLFQLSFQINFKPLNHERYFFLLKTPHLSPYLSYLQRKITTSRWRLDPKAVVVLQILSGLGFTVFGSAVVAIFQNGFPGFKLFFFSGILFFIVGFFYPFSRLIHTVRAKQRRIVKDFSYYLDLMTLGVEAGLDYATVLLKVMENSKNSPLKEELEMMVKQIQMGQSRADAWRELSSRIDLPEIHSLILAFIQTDQIGSPLAKTLRQLSDEMRSRRFQIAEKRAYQMPVKMLVPLLGCIFPAVFIILFEPLILRFLRLL